MKEECYVEPIAQPILADEPSDARIAKLIVAGMGCRNCATRVRNSLLQVKGVISADVDWKSGLTFVDYVPDQATVKRLIHAVEQAGDGQQHRYVARILPQGFTL
ncbi:MAG: heavy-metal-associated domain-containing protein [Chloroflexi bacterium]|nr:heavy-metal-associated domain-containing protein [Chloroflexota bacterium]